MKCLLSLLAAFGFGGLLAVSPVSAATHDAHASAPATAESVAPKLDAALRGLWQGHVQHTRDYALAVKAGDKGSAEKAASGVVGNARQIADAVAGFYGTDAGETMLKLLGAHWGAVKAMTDAEHAGNHAAATQAAKDLADNASAIAKFLAAANPYLPEDAVRGLLMAHGAHHQAQIGEIMRGDMQSEAKTWGAMRAHMDTIADALASALAKQFPEKAA